MSDGLLKIGLVGCGQHSHEHFNAAELVSDVKITSCCDIDKSKAKSCAEQYHIQSYYCDIDNMLKNEKLDAVILCTWPIQHAEQIQKCLQSGVKNILCEKSLALSASEAASIWKMVRENDAFIMEACKYRHHPAIKKIEELVSAKTAGKIDNIKAAFSNYEPEELSDTDFANDWRFKKECGGGVPYDWMSYLVNGCNHFAGALPRRVVASGGIGAKSGVITRIFGMIEYENGVTAFIESSKDASFSEELQLNCSNVRINLPIAWGIYGGVTIKQTRRKPEWDYILTDTFEIGEENAFVLQLQNFADVIIKNEQPVIPLHESVINVMTIDALVTSMNENEIVIMDFTEFS
jgi:predicted dehydrogenase